jgi:hypothetical protein
MFSAWTETDYDTFGFPEIRESSSGEIVAALQIGCETIQSALEDNGPGLLFRELNGRTC